MSATPPPTDPNAILAGLSVITVISLKHSDDADMQITHAGPAENGKYLGWIMTAEGRPFINTQAKFDTPADAEAHMRKVVEAARNWSNTAP